MYVTTKEGNKVSRGIGWLSKNRAKTSSVGDNFHSNSNAVNNAVHCSCDNPSTTSITKDGQESVNVGYNLHFSSCTVPLVWAGGFDLESSASENTQM